LRVPPEVVKIRFLASGDSKAAKVSFPVDKLGELTASAYKVYTVTNSGAEGGGDQILHFDSQTPFLSGAPDPTEIDLGSLQAKDAQKISIALKGYHLDKLSAIRLSKSSTDTTGASVTDIDLSVGANAAPKAVSASLGPDDIKAKIPAAISPQKSWSSQSHCCQVPRPTARSQPAKNSSAKE
jgi:hypothetical protein